MYTGDDFNYAELIAGDEQGFSHALLGIFDPIAPAAAAAPGEIGRATARLPRHPRARPCPLAQDLRGARPSSTRPASSSSPGSTASRPFRDGGRHAVGPRPAALRGRVPPRRSGRPPPRPGTRRRSCSPPPPEPWASRGARPPRRPGPGGGGLRQRGGRRAFAGPASSGIRNGPQRCPPPSATPGVSRAPAATTPPQPRKGHLRSPPFSTQGGAPTARGHCRTEPSPALDVPSEHPRADCWPVHEAPWRGVPMGAPREPPRADRSGPPNRFATGDRAEAE